MTAKRSLVVSLGALGFMLAAFSVAWACTMQAAVFGVSEAHPAPGETVTVRGLEYRGNTALEVRWQTQDGPVLATTVTGAESYDPKEIADENLDFGVHRGTFSVEVTVPADATPGEQLIWAVDPTPGALGGVGTFQVVVPGAPEPNAAVSSPELWDESAPAPAEDAPPTETPAAPAVAAPVPAAAPAVGTPEPAPVAPAPVAPATTPEPATSEPAPATAGEAPVSSEPAPTPAPAAAADWRHTHGALLHTVPATPAADSHSALLHATATPDSGAAAGELVPQVTETPDPASGLGAGFALLAVGLVVLFGGAAVTAVVRRREEVPVDRR